MALSKRTLLMLVSVVLAISMSVFGTIAYLTSSAQATNTFTVGDVEITLDETEVDEDGNPKYPVDTDGDGLKDGEEIIVITILSFEIKEVEGKLEVVVGDRMMVIGSVISNPLSPDSDMDGYNDKQDAFPMNSKLH